MTNVSIFFCSDDNFILKLHQKKIATLMKVIFNWQIKGWKYIEERGWIKAQIPNS